MSSEWLPRDLPERADFGGLTFVPLTPALVEADYAAVMADVPMLRAWSAQDWPTPDFPIEEDLVDLVRHDREQRDRIALTYSVLRLETLLGCVYVRPLLDALATRGITADPASSPEDGVVVRGWALDTTAQLLISATYAFLTAAPFAFPVLWWQTNIDCPQQLAACNALGLTKQLTFVASTTTWLLATRP